MAHSQAPCNRVAVRDAIARRSVAVGVTGRREEFLGGRLGGNIP